MYRNKERAIAPPRRQKKSALGKSNEEMTVNANQPYIRKPYQGLAVKKRGAILPQITTAEST